MIPQLKKFFLASFGVVYSLLLCQSAKAAENVLARFPNSSKTRIVFVARDQVWSVARSGGLATQLTHADGRKLMPRFSPDGKWIAFTGRQDGRQAVYVMPADGGTPQRLTWYPNYGNQDDELVVTWTPDSSSIVFASRRLAAHYSDSWLFQVPRQGGVASVLTPSQAGLAAFGRDPDTLYVSSGLHDFEPRYGYRGGQQQSIFSVNLKTHKAQQLTAVPGNDSSPMVDGDKLYFVSDRDTSQRKNLWELDLRSSSLRQLTHYASGSIAFASIGAGAITFEHGGRLVLFETSSQTLRDVDVELQGDDSSNIVRVDASRWLRDTDNLGRPDVAISPSGTSAVVSARGHLFEVDQTGSKELVSQSGADADNPSWSPDGQTLAFTLDVGTEQYLILRSRDGSTRRLPKVGSGFAYSPKWSADCKALLVPDAAGNLWLVSLEGRAVLVGRDATGVITDASFSPDGRWVAYSADRDNQRRAIHLYEVASKNDHVVSSPFDSDRLPRFSPDGRQLAFVSKRNEFTVESQSEHNFASIMSEGLYVASLSAVANAPGASSNTGTQTEPSTRVDLTGLMDRVKPLPVDAGEFSGLGFKEGALIYARRAAHWTGGDLPGLPSSIYRFDLTSQKEARLVAEAENFSVAARADRMVFQTASGWNLSGLIAGDAVDGLKASPLWTNVDEHSEWRQIFEFTWRMDRDAFADGRASGERWNSVHAAYANIVPRLGSRDDLTWLLREMQSELASSHMFVEAVDVHGSGPRVPTPLLGADLSFDSAAQVFRFAHVYRGDNSRPEYRSPLTEAGVDIREGDELLKVNGRPVPANVDPYRVFSGLVGDLTLTVRSPGTLITRDAVVHPLRSERALRWHDFVVRTRDRVDSLSGGRVGYVCMEDLHSDGLQQFIQQFYPQERKPAFVFDMRWNQGGYESQPVLERLRRSQVGYIQNRQGAVTLIPEQATQDGMVTLIGRNTISDGEQFAYFFERSGLGKLVGERSAGNVMGVGAPWLLVDGGVLAIPADTVFSSDGSQLIEGIGVRPSTVISPETVEPDGDPALQAAVNILSTEASKKLVFQK